MRKNLRELRIWLEHALETFPCGKKTNFLRCAHGIDSELMDKLTIISSKRLSKCPELPKILDEIAQRIPAYNLARQRFNYLIYDDYILPDEVLIAICALGGWSMNILMLATTAHVIRITSLTELSQLLGGGIISESQWIQMWYMQKKEDCSNLLDEFPAIDVLVKENAYEGVYG